ncbi:MAG TPA: ABC transporter permease [Candidatus Acidoferrales bacterium]|nr:ABC transporter permease [Candidatus Acidoferrales bacterium]
MIETTIDSAGTRVRRGDGFAKLWAVFVRDSNLAFSYDINFWLQWVGCFVEIGIVYLIGSLVPPSPKFGFDGRPHPYFGYLITNIAFLRFQTVAVSAFALAIRDAQTFGTLEIVLSTPTSLSFIVLSSGAYAFSFQLVQTLLILVIATFLGLDVSHINVLTFVVFVLLMIAAVAPIGVIAASATMVFKKSGPVEFFLTSMTQLFGGVYIPVKSLPLLLQPIGMLIPVAHALNGLRGGLEGASLAQLWPDVAWLCGLSLVFVPISLWLFSAAVNRAKHDGTLGQY